ncbi:competence protein ComG [Paraliobacillus quinghaiensis]|uniref:Competence protein ComG n=1 Tax=Paraliobacillus quinghaiensis TaxID=470815 RepID=A0A917TRJ3_9BACI|nr:competence type IV pilus minor pilin ComGD [Paraliobacillus quinghaiensis]GGM31641.1 competence protein ComG [Paraliobacillus quinghaiensis]
MNNQKGFTLIEILIVLSTLSILLVIGASLQTNTYDTYQLNRWYQLFESDVLYMQQQTLLKRNNLYLIIKPDTKSYEIRQGGRGKVLVERQIPHNWEVKLYTLSMPLSFSIQGTIKEPGMFLIIIDDKEFAIYFPFGKGRSYIVER